MKVAKLIIGSGIALSSSLIPLSTITSCAQSWGKLSALSIGGADFNNGPYSQFTSEYHDYDGVNYLDYLQSNYSIKLSSNETYGYSSPAKWNGADDRHDWNDLADSAWYSSGSSVFNSYASWTDTDGKKQESRNARNAALSENIAFINGIGSTLNNYVSEALAYQASQVNTNDDNNIKWAWGDNPNDDTDFSFNHGNKDSVQNAKYYEYNFALANLNGSGRALALLRSSHVGFEFSDKTFPLPSYSFTETQRTGISQEFLTLLGENSISSLEYYSTKTAEQGEEGKKYIDYTYNAVPVLIRINNLTQSYLNPQMDWSFLVNDYYATNSDVRSTIGDAWKPQLSKLTNLEYDECIPHYKSFSLTTLNEKAITRPSGDHVDKRLSNYADELKGDTFIGLMGYGLRVYVDAEHQSENTATVIGLQNVFPTSWLDKFNSDDNWFVQVREKSSTGEEPPYILNQNKINTLNYDFKQLFERKSDDGRKQHASDVSDYGKKFMTFLGYLFSDSSSLIDTDKILTPAGF